MPTLRKESYGKLLYVSTDVDDGIPKAFLCKGCYDKVAPEDGTPN